MASRGSDDGEVKGSPPLGVQLIRRVRGKDASLHTYRYSVLFMTFVAYACYHAARKPFSIVKSVLDDKGLNVTVVNGSHVATSLVPGQNGSYHLQASNVSMVESRPGYIQGWAPFNQKGGNGLLGDVDLAFLASYSIGMYFAGQLGDRLDLRHFLTGGMIGSGFFVCMFGAGYWLNIHSIYYFIFVQMMGGILQSTGWPSVVPIVGRWFGRSKRGLIMGIWNAHTSVGNIVGSLLAAAALKYGWGWSFLLPGLLQAAGGILMFFFLVADPSVVGLTLPDEEQHDAASSDSDLGKEDVETARVKDSSEFEPSQDHDIAENELGTGQAEDVEASLLQTPDGQAPTLAQKHLAVGFATAWHIPGVAPFAFCLFFSKLVAYTFLNWLPFYITQTKIAGKLLDDQTAGNLSTLFDVGGVIGGILAGHVSDKLNARAITAAGFMFAAIPALYFYRTFGGVSLATNITLMMLAGVLINGPYALITTAVSADLGSHSSLKGNPRAMATVTAIIDGTGSVGAAVGPLLTGYISEVSWDMVFVFLMVSALMAGLLLTRLVIAEVMVMIQNARAHPAVSKEILRENNAQEL